MLNQAKLSPEALQLYKGWMSVEKNKMMQIGLLCIVNKLIAHATIICTSECEVFCLTSYHLLLTSNTFNLFSLPGIFIFSFSVTFFVYERKKFVVGRRTHLQTGSKHIVITATGVHFLYVTTARHLYAKSSSTWMNPSLSSSTGNVN